MTKIENLSNYDEIVKSVATAMFNHDAECCRVNEDLWIRVNEDGTYVMMYTQWNRKCARLGVATSRDLVNWTKHGSPFHKAYGGKFENLVMGIYNAGSLNLYALPVVGAGNNANSTADIGLAPEKVITMSMVGSSLPENYEKMKVGQFTYAASSGYSAAGSAPYVVTSGYHANLKGIHPAQMFVAYDGDATDNVSYELCLKGGSDADAGEAQIAEVAGDDVTWTNPGGDGGGGGINILSLNNPSAMITSILSPTTPGRVLPST